MSATIQGLGHVLVQWRKDDKDPTGTPASAFEWAVRLRNAGWSESSFQIANLLDHAEQFDEWTLPYTCDCFDDFLNAMKIGIYRGPRDDKRWAELSMIIFSALTACIGVPNL